MYRANLPPIYARYAMVALLAAQHTNLAHNTGKEISGKETVYTLAEVSKRDGQAGKPMWVTYRGGVHDVSAFHKEHPGGDLIRQAVGGDVETFWNYWAYHFHSPKVREVLAQTRIGSLKEETTVEIITTNSGNSHLVSTDPYAEEPVRSRFMHTPFTIRPYSCETPSAVLLSDYITSADALYVRNHAPAPTKEDVRGHTVSFFRAGSHSAQTSLTLPQLLEKYPPQSVLSVLQCAGNRATEDIQATGPSGFVGTPYEFIGVGMVGNVLWKGVPLDAVLRDLFPSECETSSQEEWHVVFAGVDGYETSTPLLHILRPGSQCLLATHMNGEELTRDHGYPIRVVLPGVAGARNVKWVDSISLSKTPSHSAWNGYYYRKANLDHIQQLPVQSLILGVVPQKDTDTLIVSGIAYGGGDGDAVKKVEITLDGGETWMDASMLTNEAAPYRSSTSQSFYGWIRFSIPIRNINSLPKPLTIQSRATTVRGVTQPAVSRKQRGYLFNGWHSVVIES